MPTLLILTRAVHFGSCLVLESVFAVLFLVVWPVWQRLTEGDFPVAQNLERALWKTLLIALTLAFISGFLWLWLAIAGMSGLSPRESLQPALFWMVLTQTQPGQVWLLRLGLALVFAVLLFLVRRIPCHRPANSAASWCGALLATLLTASLAWLGHAGAGQGPQQNLQLTGDLVHLIAAGIWPGGLVPFAMVLRLCLQEGDRTSVAVAALATRRFSTLSLVAVALLSLSGLVNSYFLVGAFDALITTDYGRVLCVKLLLFAAMIAIGAWNLLRLKPQLDLAGASPSVEDWTGTLKRIKRNVLLEIVLGTVVLLVVGLLGISAPAGHS